MGVLGLGYVGTPIALEAAAVGYRVIGLDPDALARDRAAASWSRRQGDAMAGGRFLTTARAEEAPDVWLICVPTPLDAWNRPDLGMVEAALGICAQHLRRGTLVCLVSTCQPGATRNLCRPVLERSGLRVGHDIFLAVAPERENPGDAAFGLRRIPRLVGALDDRSLQHALAFWQRLTDRVVPVSSAEVAECAKLLENTYRLVNIALMGELHEAFTALGVPTREVVEAASTKPFGFAPFWPGLGAGGHCIPVDPEYLQMEAARAGAASSLLAAAAVANSRRPGAVAARIAERLGSLAGRRILVAGVCYKPDVPDSRNSAAIRLIECLREAGAEVAWTDPVLDSAPPELAEVARVHSLHGCQGDRTDAVVIGVPHRAFDVNTLTAAAPLVFDPFGLLPRTKGDGVIVV